MAISVTNSTQLSTYSLIKTILLKDSTLKLKITSNRIYNFEPKLKTGAGQKIPYIVVNVPDQDNPTLVLNRQTKIKEFTVILELVMDYTAKDNVVDYCNRIIDIIETNYTDLNASGYYNMEIVLDDINDQEVKDSKELIRSTFSLTLTGAISR